MALSFLALEPKIFYDKVNTWAEIHQALLSLFSLQGGFIIGKLPGKDKDSRVLMLMNLTLVTSEDSMQMDQHVRDAECPLDPHKVGSLRNTQLEIFQVTFVSNNSNNGVSKKQSYGPLSGLCIKCIKISFNPVFGSNLETHLRIEN